MTNRLQTRQQIGCLSNWSLLGYHSIHLSVFLSVDQRSVCVCVCRWQVMHLSICESVTQSLYRHPPNGLSVCLSVCQIEFNSYRLSVPSIQQGIFHFRFVCLFGSLPACIASSGQVWYAVSPTRIWTTWKWILLVCSSLSTAWWSPLYSRQTKTSSIYFSVVCLSVSVSVNPCLVIISNVFTSSQNHWQSETDTPITSPFSPYLWQSGQSCKVLFEVSMKQLSEQRLATTQLQLVFQLIHTLITRRREVPLQNLHVWKSGKNTVKEVYNKKFCTVETKIHAVWQKMK